MHNASKADFLKPVILIIILLYKYVIKFTYLLIYYTELSLSVKFNLKELEKLFFF